jgi:PhnB protein
MTEVEDDLRALVEAAQQAPSRFGAHKRDCERTGGMMTTGIVSSPRPTAAPHLRVRDTARAIEFYVRAFGARELLRFEAGGRIPHAEIAIGTSVIELGDEAPALGYPSPDQLGASPVQIRLDVDDPDAAVARAVAAGATIVLPVTDHFYGHRTGTVLDPFGYRWSLTKMVEDLSVEEMQRRMAMMPPPSPRAITVTPYLVVQNAAAAIDFVTDVFGAEETGPRAIGSAGGLHAEVRIGDSTVMIGGGAPELSWRGDSKPAALHVYVPDVDAAYARAIDRGAASDHEPRDMEYGERGAGVIDADGNRWYIATPLAGDPAVPPRGLHSVNVFLHPLRADPLIRFLRQALDASEVARYATPDGVVHHAQVQIGSSMIEMGEAHGPYQPIPTMFFVAVADANTSYRRALAAGATSLVEPVDREFGHLAAVEDPFGNQWHFVTGPRSVS